MTTHQINNFYNEVNEEIAFNLANPSSDDGEYTPPKPYEKHRLEGGTRTPTRFEFLIYKKRINQNVK